MYICRQEITFYVYAADNGSPRALTSTATVTVEIEDTNDSPPRIFSVSDCNDLGSAYAGGYYECRIQESDAPGVRRVTHITPIDPDEEPLGTRGSRGPRALFSLEDASPGIQTLACAVGGANGQRGGKNAGAMFFVTADGTLYANGSLDREKCASYMLRVRLRDPELPHLESSALFRVVIDDENDHAPVFILPNASAPARALRVSYQQPPGSVVGRVLATDADDGPNAAISYHILSSSSPSAPITEQPPLGVQPDERGMLYVLSSLEAHLDAMLQLRIEACDRGRPPRCTSEPLFVHVLNIPPSVSQHEPTPAARGEGTDNLKMVQERSDELKVLIVLAASLFSVALLLALGVLLMCTRRHIFAGHHLRSSKGIV